MKGTESLELLGDINEKYIASAECMKKRNSAWRIALPIAAGFCLVLGVGLILGKILGNKPDTGNDITAMASENAQNASPAAEVTAEPTEYVPAIPEEDRIYLTADLSSYDEAYHPDETPYIEWGIDYQMFIYQGREYFLLCTLDAMNDVIGEKVGTVELFDFQWSARWCHDEEGSPANEEHPFISISENELKGTVEGSVFSFKGRDDSDFLCMRGDYRSMICVYTTDCGITEKNGAAFLEDKLNISENMQELRYISRNDFKQYAVDPRNEAVRLFIEAIDEGEWINDTRSYFSRYFDEPAFLALVDEELNPCRNVNIYTNDRLDLEIGVFTDGIVTIGNSFHSMALQVDVEKISPLLDLMAANYGECMENKNDDDRLAACRNNRRFGEMIPTYIPDGLRVTDTYIEYITDAETGDIIGTDHIRIDYKDEDLDSIIYFCVMPIEQTDTDYSIRCAVEKGVRNVDIEDFDESCMYLSHSNSIGCEDEIYSQSVVTYKDAVIYIQAFDTQPEVIIALIRSIID